jgi:hypothetical protein
VLAAILKEDLNHNLISMHQSFPKVLELTKVRPAVMSKEKKLQSKFNHIIVA